MCPAFSMVFFSALAVGRGRVKLSSFVRPKDVARAISEGGG
jgi:hypothetical protein